MIYRFVCPYFETAWVVKEATGALSTDIVIHTDAVVFMSLVALVSINNLIKQSFCQLIMPYLLYSYSGLPENRIEMSAS